MDLLTVTERDVLNLGGRGGEPFVDLVNRLLHAEATMAGRPSAAVTTLSVDESDSGVDARLDITRASAVEWFTTPTCWQFKSGSLPPKKAVAEINKPYVRELLKEGYTYRVCVRAGLTPLKRANLERALLSAARKIAPQTAPPRVLDAGDLAIWCSQYPALVVSLFKPHLANVLYFEAWREVARASTDTFIRDARFDRVKAAIDEHARFNDTPTSAIIAVGGAPGSGRSRLVFEAIADAGLGSLVLYADSEAQLDTLSTTLANETSTHAVLVAGECSPALRERIRVRLSGSRKRVRVIAVAPSDTPVDRCNVWIARPEREVIKQIVDVNFSAVDETRRGAFLELGSPHLSIIIDLLTRHFEVGEDGDLTRVIDPISAMLDASLTPDERNAVAAASLIDRLDLRPDSPSQLSAVAAVSGIGEQDLREVLQSLSERRLFTGDEDEMIRVEPPAVASLLFRDAWLRWGENIDAHDHLSTALLGRAAKCHDPNVRAEIAIEHEGWMHRVDLADLTPADSMRRFLLLVEIDPSRYLPVLVRLMETAALDELAHLSSRSDVTHLCDKLAGFHDWFDGVERVLFRLALRETQTFSNNATFYWTGLFALALSSTTVPFPERLKRLETRILQAKTSGELDLAFSGLSVTFSDYYWRVAPDSYVGGRLRPAEPLPGGTDFVDHRWSAFALLQRLVTTDKGDLRSRAVRLVLKKLWFFLNAGLLPEARTILAPSIMTEDEFQDALSTVREYVHVHSDNDTSETPPYLNDVRAWIDELVPDTPEKRIWEFFTRDQDPDDLEGDARTIAPDLLRDNIEFVKVQRIVERGNAYRAVLLGTALGSIDSNARRLVEIVDAAKPAQGFSFYRGYVGALVAKHPQHLDVVNSLLDQLESTSPEVCAEIALGGLRATRALERLTRLVKDDKVDPSRARDLAAAGERALSPAEFTGFIDLLRSKIERFPSTADTGLDMIWWRLHSSGRAEPIELEAFTRFIDSMTLLETPRELRHWGMAIEELAKHDPATTIVLAAKGLGSASNEVQFHAQKILAQLAKDEPRAVTNTVGQALLAHEGIGWHFVRLSALYLALPLDVVKEWLDHAGAEGAKAIAPHLAWPKLVDGQPFVPPLTTYVLDAFEDDDEVFAAFSRGVVIRSYHGDIEAEHEKEAAMRRLFLNHPLRRIHEWAINEVEMAKRSARHWRQGRGRRSRRRSE